MLGDEGAADKDLEEAEAISDNHSVSLGKIYKTFRKNQQVKSQSSGDSGVPNSLNKHSLLKLHCQSHRQSSIGKD